MASFTFRNPFASPSSTPPRASQAAAHYCSALQDPSFNPHDLSCDTVVLVSSSSERDAPEAFAGRVHVIMSPPPPHTRAQCSPIILASSSSSSSSSPRRTAAADQDDAIPIMPPAKRARPLKLHAAAAASTAPNAAEASMLTAAREACPCKPLCFPPPPLATAYSLGESSHLNHENQGSSSGGGGGGGSSMAPPIATPEGLRRWAAAFPLALPQPEPQTCSFNSPAHAHASPPSFGCNFSELVPNHCLFPPNLIPIPSEHKPI
jgi:hypothetical protein